MSAIQSSIGLITGIPIEDTVNQLIAISSRPRNLVAGRNQQLVAEQTAVDRLASLVLSLKFSANKFNTATTFTGRTAKSSNPAVGVAVARGSTPKVGSYRFTPLQAASANQYVSKSFEDLSDAVGDGTLRFGFGGHIDKGVALRTLNGGAGVTAGRIKITDKNGDTATIDLRAALTVDDVILAINSSSDISVTAAAEGDAFTLTDNSGGSGTLRVSEVGLGTTATDLGLGGKSTTGDTLTGDDIYRLHEGTKLSALNGGVGVRITDSTTELDNLSFTLRDGTTTFGVDLSGAVTLGDVVDAINDDEDNEGQLTAAISADGRRLELTDNTGSTAANLIVTNGVLGSAAEDLGITADEATDTVTGRRLDSGLRDSLLTSLNGGQGFTLGSIEITNRAGGHGTVDLSSAETVGDVVELINAAGIDVAAAINASRSGVLITDTSGGSGNLIIADVGAETSATDLGIATDDAIDSVNSGSLRRQTIGEATLLSSLNGGDGISLGDFRITDSSGKSSALSLDTPGAEAETVGDVIDAINALSIGVTASLNETGDGILLTDTAGGAGALTVAEVGDGVTAADLNLVGASSSTNTSGQQTIDGSFSYSVDLTDLDQDATGISLASLNGGNGVDLGIFQIVAASDTLETDDEGNTTGTSARFTVNLGAAGKEAFTVGDVIDLINEAAATAGVAVTAAINSAGTGIGLTDATDGSGELTVNELNGSLSPAADLKLLRTAVDKEDDSIDGAGLFSATAGEQGALNTLVDRINALDAGVTASIVSDQIGYRLAITANEPGAANQLLIDGATTEFTFQEISRAQDAVALFGGSAAGGGFTVTSTTNQFNNVVEGLNLTVNQTTGEAVTITVASDDTPLVKVAEEFVATYNSLRTTLDEYTDFNAETLSTGILFGRNEALRVDTDLARLISGTFVSGKFGSLESVGLSLGDDGKLTLDTQKLRDAFAENPTGVETLFQDEDTGVLKKITAVIDALASDDSSLLLSRSQTLQRTIENNESRITRFDEQLTRERERLLTEFFRLEETIALLQSNLDSINAIQPIAISSNRSSQQS